MGKVVSENQKVETFEEFWASLQEIKEIQRRISESMEEYDRERKEDKDAFNARLGSLTNLFGDFTLGMVAPKLRDKFENLGLVFLRSYLYSVVEDRINNVFLRQTLPWKTGKQPCWLK